LQYSFEWDPSKARRNIKKHRVAFERAATVFLDARALTIFDEGHSGEEERWVTLGADNTGTLLVICHTFVEDAHEDGARVRIISARKATRREQRQYADIS
jgi:uncharacterized protein